LRVWALGLSLAGLLSLSATPSLALTLGRAKMLSKQGEPLAVEFDLESLSPEEQLGLEVGLADEQAYRALGATYDAVLSGAKAILSKRAGGQLYVSVTSKTPVGQSFVDVLLQVHWSSGQVTKEMGLLLDAAQSVQADSSNPLSQVPVHPGDTASALALKYKDATVTLDQMLMGILRSNPNAFVAQNVNRLKSDANLTLPSTQDVLNLKPKDASEQVQLQRIDFDQYRQALVAKLQRTKPSVAKTPKQNASGQVGSKTNNLQEKKDQLKLSEANTPAAKAADLLVQEEEAKLNAKKANELSQNIDELKAVAQHTGATWSVQNTLKAASNSITKAWSVPKAWLSVNAPQLANWLDHPLAPVLAGLGLVVLVLGALLRKRASTEGGTATPDHDAPHQPWMDPESMHSDTPPAWAQVQPHASSSPTAFSSEHELMQDGALHGHESALGAPLAGASTTSTLSDHVHIDFDLDLPPLHESNTLDAQGVHETTSYPSEPKENPLQVRFELAQELWQVGQQHTARAIVQEIAQQATGELLDAAHAWLAERG
jgi:pilus assembly protein FimV